MRPNYMKFSIYCAVLGAVVGALFAGILQFLRDVSAVSLGFAWDMLLHLPTWEWVSPGRVICLTIAGVVLAPLFMTTAYWLSESPRWSK